MSEIRKELPPLPVRMRNLPVDARGYPVPAFVAWIDGKPDFRVSDGRHMANCVQFSVCWICGQKLGRHVAFVIGPMCAINRVSSEPPSHKECAVFAAKACPFLVRPHAKRRQDNIPEDATDPAGVMIRRNPGVALVWVTRDTLTRFDGLFDVGNPEEVLWFAEGREATRGEVLASVESGLPALETAAREEGPGAVAQLAAMRAEAMAFLPKPAP